MARRELRVPVRYYLRLAEVLARHRVDLAQVLRDLRLPDSLLTEADATLDFAQVDKLIGHLCRLTGRSDLGHDLGKLLSVSTHSIVGFGMLSSPDVEHAMRFVARYFRLVMPSFRMRYRSGADFGELHFTPVVAMGHDCLLFHLEAIALAALRDVRELAGGRTPACRMSLSIPRPAHAKRYAELRGVQTEFGMEPATGARLLFEGDLRDCPLVMADPNALKVAEERCRAQVAHVASTRQLADWVAMTLREVGEGLPGLAELATTLNLSPRTLNRYLAREGTNFRELSGRIQHELACERLAANSMSITQVASSLGFDDPANFTRSFRDRAGCSPRAYRQKLEKQGR